MGSDAGRDRDRRRDRSRSRSRDRDRSRRSRSRSRSRDRKESGSGRRRKTLFDVGPGGAPAPAPAAPAFTAPTSGFSAPPPGFSAAPSGFSAAPAGFSAPAPGFPGALPGPPAYAPPSGMGAFPNMPNMPMGMTAPPSQQATRHARRVYVGGLPPTATEASISIFFSSALAAIGGNAAGPGNAVVNVYINKEKNFSFVEFRTVEETSNAMALDGIMFEGVSVRVRRPNDYNPAAAAALGPSAPNPNLNLAAIGLGAAKQNAPEGVAAMPSMRTLVQHDENRIFVGGIPYYLNEDQCKELLGSFGAIKHFELIKDKETGQGKGYGFVVYQDPAVTDIAIAGLNGLKMGERTLTVRRAEPPGGGVAAAPMGVMHAPISLAGTAAAMPPMPGVMPAAPPVISSRIVVLQDAVSPDELADEEEYKDIVEDMREECGKHGALRRVIIPRPTPAMPNPVGVAKVIIEYEDGGSAMRARNAMHGRKFGGRTVQATYLPEEKYLRGEFDG